MEDRIIISLHTEPGKRRHTCVACEAYKREIKKKNKEALLLYIKHIYEVAQKSGGNNFIIRKSEVLKKDSQEKINEVIFSLPKHSKGK
ncbi:hypothetical protein M1373_01925 [Candidatus Marsarchaeota archaeon]|nr:hypothetical protein [Candidatus Marsarchaeota archaeon]MCL5404351.1 hypothetical protein [Candidatus Marsarchaeota archaeon]